MLKLREMQLKQQQAKAAAEASANPASSSSTPANPADPAATNGTNTLLMHRGGSKESLVELRKGKSRDNVFSLKTKQSGESASKRANAAELRAQKGMITVTSLTLLPPPLLLPSPHSCVD